MEAQKYVWEGAIPLQIHLHDSEVTTLPSPPPALVRFQSSLLCKLVFFNSTIMLVLFHFVSIN